MEYDIIWDEEEETELETLNDIFNLQEVQRGGTLRMFELLGYIEEFATCGNTSHVAKRSKRLQVAERLIIEESAKVIRIAVVNKGHANGEEVHVVYNNGVVKVYNERTHKFITVLIARVPQIERYNIKVTKAMRKKINTHIKQGYNHIEFQEAKK